MIGIIDYGAGNLFSVKNALDYLRYETMYYAVSLVRQELWEAFNAQIAEHFGDELR